MAAVQATPARTLPDDQGSYQEIGKGDFPLFSFPPRGMLAAPGEDNSLSPVSLRVRANKPHAVLWLSGPVEPVDVGLTMPIYAVPTIELHSDVARWTVTVRPEMGWIVMQSLALEDGRVLVSNAVIVRVGP